MTRTMSSMIVKRAALLGAVAALAVPATASAMPDRGADFGRQATASGPTAPTGTLSTHAVGQPWLSASMHRVGQPWPTQSVNGGSVPTTRVTTSVVHTPTGQVVSQTSQQGFEWTDALIGSAVTAAILALAAAGTLAVRRRPTVVS
jgi:hypothetical protein